MNWYEANGRCHSMGMHLVSITSKEENNFVKKQLQESEVLIIIQTYQKDIEIKARSIIIVKTIRSCLES